jgi:thiamine biosynthesis lipoprotein
MIGMHLVHLDPNSRSVRFEREGVMIDLGAIGKGYAIDRAVELLRDAGITSALVHGGTSTIYGLGRPPDADAWRIEIASPLFLASPEASQLLTCSSGPAAGSPGKASQADSKQGRPPHPFATVSLRDTSLSVSAVWGKFFHAQGRNFGHIIDPRNGEPAGAAVMSAVVLPSATETDALSTALLTLGPTGHDHIGKLRADIRTLAVGESNGRFEVMSHGIAFEPLDGKESQT